MELKFVILPAIAVVIFAIFFYRLLAKDAYYGLGAEKTVVLFGVGMFLVWSILTVASLIDGDDLSTAIERIRIIPYFSALFIIGVGGTVLAVQGFEWLVKKMRQAYNRWLLNRD